MSVTMTQVLRGPLTKESAALALRDSLDRVMPRRQLDHRQWHYSTTGEGLMRPVSPE